MASTKIKLVVGPDQEDNVAFGVLLRSLRDEADLSRGESASLIGISPEFLRLIERGARTPAAGTARLMLNEYNVEFETTSVDDKYVLIFRGYRVEFTSRIQEARQTKVRLSVHAQSRHEMIGQIVALLTIVDDETLEKLKETLLR